MKPAIQLVPVVSVLVIVNALLVTSATIGPVKILARVKCCEALLN